ncbi:lysine methyltransferase METTL21D [Micractinium conductrix]|uniref:Lysine methyltransferase METTL21D n=1 Tax=Micractinium conductrix TaxID=554055 RepID=A0A2P6VEI7_9CHLO|nr:lysine methyltransferase METTL21D [Micractinium conductrix]|eukprot:PSC72502.1 lysine methyltransferase METTL21D [Micractinium conductrix]
MQTADSLPSPQAPGAPRRASGSATSQRRESTPGEGEQSAGKRRRASTGGGVSTGNEWLRAWAWKREHRPDKVRFDRPYLHQMSLPGGGATQLTVHQSRFKEQGFASTVWDSSIVLAKLFEKHPQRWAGRRCLDLSAGCGLPGLALCKLGADAVTATDLAPNLPLLRKNAEANGCDIAVVEHSWGEPPCAALQPRFDVIAACDVMYVCEAIPALVASLAALVARGGEIYISHGRNRQAEPEFLAHAAAHFSVETVGSEELDEVYQSADVDVLRVRPLTCGAPAGGAPESGTADAAADGEAGALPTLPQPEALLQHPPAAALPQPGSLLLQPPLLAPALGAPAGRSNPLPYPDVREAANSGAGKLTKSLEPLLFIQSGAINPALATRNRKTEWDIVEPSPAVCSLVQAFEALCSRLAAHGGDARAGLMQEAWTACLSRVLRPGNGSVRSLVTARLQGDYAGAALARGRQAVLACTEAADAALAGPAGSSDGDGGAAAALVVLEAMQRFAVRCILPVAPAGGLHAFPWLEAAVWDCCAALRPAGPTQPEGWPPMSGRSALEAALARLHEVHEAFEDAAGRLPEGDRQRTCRAVLAAAGAAALGDTLRAGAAAALNSMCASCLDALGPGSAGVRQRVEAALSSASRLAGRTHKLAAAAELLERAARVMRLEPGGFPQCMWQVLSALQLE